MRHFIYLLVLFPIVISCLTKENESDFSVNWLIEYNEKLNNRIKISVQEKGSRKGDSTIAAKSKVLILNNREILNSLNEANIQDQIHAVGKTLLDDPQLDGISIGQYFDLTNLNNVSLQEIKRRILLYELQALTNLSRRIGEQDISFNKFDVYFIPEDYSNLRSKELKGHVIFTAMSDRIGESADFYFNSEKLQEINSTGIVDFDRYQLTKMDSIEIKIKFSEWEIKKMISIK